MAGESSTPPDGALHAVFDPFSGISGDMILGCWVDLGLDRDWLMEVADLLELSVTIEVRRAMRAGLSAARVIIEPHEGSGGGHGRHWSEIRDQIEESGLQERAKALALAAFARLAEAEARVHGVPPEGVHFHEVGAVDAILDFCAAADGFVRLGIEEASSLPVALGSGTVRIAHGDYPVPAPATAYLLEGMAVRHATHDYECVTPTGAALLAEFCGGRVASGDHTIARIGYGAGSHDPEDHPNCLRVWLSTAAARREAVVILQTDLDDLSPEYLPGLVDACLAAGALDVVVQPVHMKKGRPGWRIDVQVEPAQRDAVEAALLDRSTTLGVRSWSVTRRTLARSVERRRWRGHDIRLKRRQGAADRGIRDAKLEYDDVVAAARAEGLEVSEVHRLLREAWPDVR